MVSPTTENNEEARAFLQARLALFWKVLFLFTLAGGVLGLLAKPMVDPGPDLLITFGEIVLAGCLWWLCRRGKRSIRFCRIVDAGGLFVSAFIGVFLTRFLLIGFLREHALVSSEGTLMADAYISLIDLMPFAMFLAIRAALVPSQPRRTFFITAMVGAPRIVLTTLLVPAADGGLTRRHGSDAYPWLPSTAIMMWMIATITCTVISKVIYGLRAEVREARKFGQYVLERRIGEGAMGVVYRATHAMLRRPAAIKLLLKDRASEADLLRFEREVQLTSRLVHPNTISIFDYGRAADGTFYYVMEYLDGLDLQHLVDQYGPIDPARTIHILAQISGALAEAHALGLIHRDIKPANVVLTERPDEPDVVKVVDFGLVKKFGGNLAESAASEAITGTPLYMAPEAISRPDTIDGRSDLYAVGAVAYFLLTGRHVFEAATVIEICSKHMLEAPVPPSQRLGKALPADLEAIVLACLAKDRADRPASAAVLRTSLLACADANRLDLPATQAWWTAFRASRKDSSSTVDKPDSRPGTMAIDLGGRSTVDLG
ncbi:MAG: serine/threonine protein kinase [Myxococcales bacterium]|nr:serine/threonine protein kinase [Myxococcales bacterium]